MTFSLRQLNFAGFVACVGLMAYALYAQYGLGLSPCPLCVFQRIAVITLGVVFLVAAIHGADRAGQYVYGAIIGMTAIAGIGVAGRHLWLQSLPADQVPSCGPGLDFIMGSFPLAEAIQMVFSGSGECAKVDWQLLGLAMPAWVVIALLAVGGFGVAVNWRGERRVGE